MKAIAIISYVAALIVANLIVSKMGPAVMPVLAFVLIGLDLALRDWLHERLSPALMLGLIVGAGLLTWALNPAAGRIALASATAFTLAAVVDWLVFRTMAGEWLRRSVASNAAGAAVDSVAFPLLAFGVLPPDVVLLMWLAKTAGGALWAVVLRPRVPA